MGNVVLKEINNGLFLIDDNGKVSFLNKENKKTIITKDCDNFQFIDDYFYYNNNRNKVLSLNKLTSKEDIFINILELNGGSINSRILKYLDKYFIIFNHKVIYLLNIEKLKLKKLTSFYFDTKFSKVIYQNINKLLIELIENKGINSLNNLFLLFKENQLFKVKLQLDINEINEDELLTLLIDKYQLSEGYIQAFIENKVNKDTYQYVYYNDGLESGDEGYLKDIDIIGIDDNYLYNYKLIPNKDIVKELGYIEYSVDIKVIDSYLYFSIFLFCDVINDYQFILVINKDGEILFKVIDEASTNKTFYKFSNTNAIFFNNKIYQDYKENYFIGDKEILKVKDELLEFIDKLFDLKFKKVELSKEIKDLVNKKDNYELLDSKEIISFND